MLHIDNNKTNNTNNNTKGNAYVRELICKSSARPSRLFKSFQLMTVNTLKLPAGSWAIFGKVAIWNSDGDPQNTAAYLYATSGTAQLLLDKIDVRIPGGCSESISLLGNPEVQKQDEIQIRCSTYNGGAAESRLIAIQIDGKIVIR